jgi:predicted metal-dependent peptidase
MAEPMSVHEATRITDLTMRELKKARLKGLTEEAFIASVAIPMQLHVCTKSNGRPVPTAATSGKHLYANPHFWHKLTGAQKVTLMLHEFWHAALAHHLRRGTRNFKLWNIACDHRINLMLKEAGFSPLPNWLCAAKYTGWSEERIYAYKLDEARQREQEKQEQEEDDDDTTTEPGGQPGGEGGEDEDEDGDQPTGGGDPGVGGGGSDKEDGDNVDTELEDDDPEAPSGGEQPEEDEIGDDKEEDPGTGGGSSTELDEEEEATPNEKKDEDGDEGEVIGEVWDAEDEDGKEMGEDEKKEELQRIKEDSAINRNMSKDSGKGADTSASRLVDTFVRSRVNWEQELFRKIRRAGTTYGRSWTTLDRRALANGIYQPAEIKEGIGWCVAGWDVSSSIDYVASRAMVSALNEIKTQMSIERMTIVPFNERVQVEDIIDLGKGDIIPNEFNVGGGTCFAPVFQWINEQDRTPDVIIMFTDLEDWSYGDPPHGVPVIWASTDPVYDSNAHWREQTNRPPFGDVVEISVES